MIYYFAGADYHRSTPVLENYLFVWKDKGINRLLDLTEQLDDCSHINILVDSGAFSAFTQGKTINIDDYIEWIKNFKKKWKEKVNDLNFINLDVIGDPVGSEKNLRYMNKNGVEVLPVLHQAGFKEKTLEKYLHKYNYICFGGMVGRPVKTDTIPWLNKCFTIIGKNYRKTGKMPKIHLLGIGNERIMYKYPAYSVDNTNWLSLFRFGRGNFIKTSHVPKGGLKKIHNPYKYEDKYDYNRKEDYELVGRMMEFDVKRFLEVQQEVTKFWKQKGVDFDKI